MADKSNEIPAGRTLLDRLDLEGTIALLDALHTHVRTIRAIVQEGGGDWPNLTLEQPCPANGAADSALDARKPAFYALDFTAPRLSIPSGMDAGLLHRKELL